MFGRHGGRLVYRGAKSTEEESGRRNCSERPFLQESSRRDTGSLGEEVSEGECLSAGGREKTDGIEEQIRTGQN